MHGLDEINRMNENAAKKARRIRKAAKKAILDELKVKKEKK